METQVEDDDPDNLPQDTFKILLASDIHLGYAEKDAVRGNDTFNTFEEILQLAERNEVDFILLGGDLFHDSKPSMHCLHECLRLLHQYCMGDRPISVEFVSDQAENFQHCVNPIVNYEDPNLNISIPVYSIHGNHDDPSGFSRMAALDILSASGLVNYFGKWTDYKRVNISPLLLTKGQSKLAIYGLSYIKDERLSRLFRDNIVKWMRPREETDEWFNIFVLHQNRANRGMNNYIKEEVLPTFLDLILWGHEHECLIEPQRNTTQEFDVTQPGSTVVTSLCEGEVKPKHVAILKIYKKEPVLNPIKLRTVRPFVMETVVLSKCSIQEDGERTSQKVQDYLKVYVEDMIRKAASQITGHEKQPRKPLIRLRVEYKTEEQCFNPIRFGQQYCNEVANPTDMVILRKEKSEKKKNTNNAFDRETMENLLQRDELPIHSRVEAVVAQYFSEAADTTLLQVLSVKGLNEAVTRFIDKDEKDAISRIAKYQMAKTVAHLQNIDVTEEHIEKEIENFRLSRVQIADQEKKDVEKFLPSQVYKNGPPMSDDSYMEIDADSDDNSRAESMNCTPSASTSGKGKGHGRGSTNTSESKRGGRGSHGRGSRASRARGTQSNRSTANAPIYTSSDSD